MVISDPALDPSRVVLVNFTTNRQSEEQCCVVKGGEHPFLTHPSAVRYRDARITSVAALESLVKQDKIKVQCPLSAQLLEKVRAGAAESELLPEGCRQILNEQFLI